MSFKSKLKQIGWGYLFISVLTLIISILFFIFGIKLVGVLAIGIGIVVILSAALLTVFTMSDKQRGFAFGFKIAVAAALLIAGIVVLIARESVMNVIVSAMGLVMLIDGCFKLHSTVSVKKQKSHAWWIFFSVSVLIIACGYYIVSFPQISRKLTVYIVASALFWDSLANFLTLFFWKKLSE